MTLRAKVLLANLGALVVVCWLVKLATSSILTEGFRSVERASTRQDAERVIDALEEEETLVCRGDWSAWNDTYRYVADPNSAYRSSNLVIESFGSLDADFLGIYNAKGEQVWAAWKDPASGKLTPIPADLKGHLRPDSYLFKHSGAKDLKAGLLSLPSGVLLMGSRPIVRSDFSGKIRGTFVAARMISSQRLAKLSERLHLDIQFSQIATSKPRASGPPQERLVGKNAQISILPQSEERVAGITTLPDIYGDPALRLNVSTSRSIYQKGQQTLNSLVLAACGVAAFFMILCMMLVERLVLIRLSRIAQDVDKVTTSGELSRRVKSQGTDELGQVTLAINEMLKTAEEADSTVRYSEAQARNATKLHELASRRFQELFDGLPIACFTYDSDGLIHEWNRASEALWCIPASEAVFRPIHEIIESIDKDRADIFVQRVFSGEQLEDTEWQATNREGRQMWLITATIPLQDATGALTGALGATIDITSRKQAELQMAELAATDSMTGLPNQRAFRQGLDVAWANAKRSKKPLSLILLDVDKFKLFNDMFGHVEGDEVLIQVGQCLRESVRPSDLVARYGGEEFVVVLPDADSETAIKIAERCRKKIESRDWPHRAITASFGVATWTEGATEFSHFVGLADRALYASKENGRNRVTHVKELKKIA